MKLNGIPWEEVARLYRHHRPGPPDSWYGILDGLGLRAPGQHVVDLGTGPGSIALEFARRGAHVTGIDKSAGQIAQAREAAEELGLEVKFLCCGAENLPDLRQPVDMVVASMCWGYFDQTRVLDRLLPQLRPTGRLIISRHNWVESSPVGTLTSRALDRVVPNRRIRPPAWLNSKPRTSDHRLRLTGYLCYEENVVVTPEKWVKRVLASRHLAGMPAAESASFAQTLSDRLREALGAEFSVPHYIESQIFAPSLPGDH
jgi:SAM-dependent methyltransferase